MSDRRSRRSGNCSYRPSGFLAEPLVPVVGVATDDVDDTRNCGLLGQRLIADSVDRGGVSCAR